MPKSAKIFEKSWSHLKTLRARSFHIQDPPILGAGVQSSVATATQHPRFVHPCFLHEQSSSHNPNKITKQHKINPKESLSARGLLLWHVVVWMDSTIRAHFQSCFDTARKISPGTPPDCVLWKQCHRSSDIRKEGPRAWHKSDNEIAVATLSQAGEHSSVRCLTNRS